MGFFLLYTPTTVKFKMQVSLRAKLACRKGDASVFSPH